MPVAGMSNISPCSCIFVPVRWSYFGEFVSLIRMFLHTCLYMASGLCCGLGRVVLQSGFAGGEWVLVEVRGSGNFLGLVVC